MNRRSAALGLLATGAFLRVGWAQHARAIPVIGFLSGRSAVENAPQVAAFHQGLAEEGFVDGKNIAIEYRWAEGRYGRLPQLASDLVERKVALIVTAGGTPSALAAKEVTTTIPIVFNSGGDLEKLGLVGSFRRPEGNITGISQYTTLLGPKRLELLRELHPRIKMVGLLGNGSNPNFKNEEAQMNGAADALAIRVSAFTASNRTELESAFKAITKQRMDAFVVAADAFIDDNRRKIVAFALRHHIPAIYPWPEYVRDGGLMSYGIDTIDSYREAGRYAGKILKGAKPNDLPVVQPSKFQLAVNLRTSRVLGIVVPPAIVLRADQLIE